MYSKIVNPKTGRKVSIKSKLGKTIIQNYINYSDGGASIVDGRSKKKVYFDEIGTITKKIAKSGVFRQANKMGTLILFPTIMVIDPDHNVLLVLEGPPKNFTSLLEEVL